MLGKLLGRGDQDGQLHEFLKPVQIADMFLCGCERVERSDVGGGLALLD